MQRFGFDSFSTHSPILPVPARFFRLSFPFSHTILVCFTYFAVVFCHRFENVWKKFCRREWGRERGGRRWVRKEWERHKKFGQRRARDDIDAKHWNDYSSVEVWNMQRRSIDILGGNHQEDKKTYKSDITKSKAKVNAEAEKKQEEKITTSSSSNGKKSCVRINTGEKWKWQMVRGDMRGAAAISFVCTWSV